MKNLWKREKIIIGLTILLMMSLFFILNMQFKGPAYLSDEIGYLNKASTLAGYKVDGSSSWLAGYSILIAPAFLFLNGPTEVWRGVVFLNAAMFGLSFWMLYKILRTFFPLKSSKSVYGALVATMLYPSWITMTGYSFSTPGTVLVMTASIYFLQKSRFKSSPQLMLSAILAGFLYWTHPVGLAYILSFSAVFVLMWLKNKRDRKYLVYPLISMTLVVIYLKIFSPWLNGLMTPSGFLQSDHYSVFFNQNTLNARFGSLRSLIKILVTFLGQSSALIVSTFGLVIFPLSNMKISKNSKSLKKLLIEGGWKNDLTERNLLLLVLFGTLILSLCISAITLTTTSMTVHYWMYTRYTESLMLPLLGIGVLSLWTKKVTKFIAAYLIFVGLLFYLFVPNQTALMSTFNKINVASMWVQITHNGSFNFLASFSAGALAIMSIAILAKYKKKWLIVSLVPVLLGTTQIQQDWHRGGLEWFSKPSTLEKFVFSNYSSETDCVGISYVKSDEDISKASKNERMRINLYYLYQYQPTRLTFDEWYAKCEGPYLTFDWFGEDVRPGTRYVGREKISSLYVLVKKKEVFNLSGINSDDFYVNLENEDCVLFGCKEDPASR